VIPPFLVHAKSIRIAQTLTLTDTVHRLTVNRLPLTVSPPPSRDSRRKIRKKKPHNTLHILFCFVFLCRPAFFENLTNFKK